MADKSPLDPLIFDIGYALKRAGVRLPIEACRQLGARVLAHLKLARCEFTRRPPGEAHGSALPPKESGSKKGADSCPKEPAPERH